jgi:hypothetical protein
MVFDPTPKHRDVMRELIADLGLDEDKVCRGYALAEESGKAPRKRNKSGLSSDEYARALWRDGRLKGWF